MPGVQLRVEPNGFGIALHDQSDSLSDKATLLHFAVRVTLLGPVFRLPIFELAAGLQGVWLRDEQSGIEVERTWFGPN